MNYIDADTLGEMGLRFWKIVHDELSDRLPQEFRDWLETTDFFQAPASAGHHLNCEGGLLAHSLNVYDNLRDIARNSDILSGFSGETLALVSLFHDLCKANSYQQSFRNQKQPDGSWARVPCYTTNPALPMGHGEKSVYLLLQHGVRLTDEEALAIRWHMSGFDDAVKGGCRDMNRALALSPLVLALQQADMRATYWTEL